MKPTSSSTMAVKRAFDICAALFGLTLCLPFWAPVAVAIKLDSTGPVFWRQVRIGRAGRPFRILKFRTMRVAAEGAGPNYTVANDARITHVGMWLRATKFDELPQLFNVLFGDMSMVGPRPETPDLMADYTQEQRAVMLALRPGITDYASVLLRDEGRLLSEVGDPARFYRETLIPTKYRLCRRYQDEIGLRADIKIIFMTLGALSPRRPPAVPKMANASRAVGGSDVLTK